MGSGKSAVGRLLAKEKKSYFLDTDALIESSEGSSIHDIFEKYGEKYFRCLEENTVEWLIHNVKGAVISTGGGMLVYCEKLKEAGQVIYLKVPFDTILSRMNNNELKKRPLFDDVNKAKEIYQKRTEIYEKRADVIIDADGDLETVLSRLLAAIT